MKHRNTISLLLLTFLLIWSGSVHAQLLEDTDRKLKTSKTNRKFRLFKKKAKRTPAPFLSFGKTSSGKTITPNYSSGIPFRGRVANIRTRTASGSPFLKLKFSAPRFSSGSPFLANQSKVKPRFSVGMPFNRKEFAVAPRYSGPSPFLGVKWIISPRFSTGKPFTRKEFAVAPRYSGPSPFLGVKWKIQPRFSTGMPFTRKDLKVAARYPSGSPFAYKKWKIKPRDANYMSFNLRTRRIVQSFFPNKYVSSFQGRLRFYGPAHLQHFSSEIGNYLGPFKLKAIKPGKNLHPSSRYKRSVLVSSEAMREGLRKWNIFWTGFSRNSEASKGVKEKVSKPKFNRKEREIWNN